MVSSHILAELAEMCTHIGIIEHGKLLASGDVGTIMRSLTPHRIYEVHLLSDMEAAAALVRGLPGVLEARVVTDSHPPMLQIDYEGHDDGVSDILARLINGGAQVTHFAGQRSDLEDIFLQITDQAAAAS
ncbi:MAG: DUF4162 domain-containing protein [Chloroflexaceae bacterium]|nr:DUF4162 domain-containing protein [Chloroflexaceae bacterium]